MNAALYPPPRPLPVRLLNAVGRRLPPLSLDSHRLLALARRQTGLEDFGDASFLPALERLCNALQQEAQLSTLGRMIVRRSLLERLCYRLRLVDYRRQHPEVAEQTISRPLFIAGMPRTGTTILYELLAQDPQHRFPLSWEVERPVPPPSADSLHSDPRIAAVQRQFDQVDRLIPDFKSIHEIGAELPQECVSILAYHFMSELWNVGYDIPSYRDWLARQDFLPAYQWHRQFLQHLQSGCGEGQRWLLKTPPHIACLDALLAVYPDACVVQTHRDPMQVMASLSSLTCTLRSFASDHIDPVAVGRAEVQMWAEMLEKGMEARQRLAWRSHQFFDIRFEDLLKRPIDVIEALYAHFGFDFSEELRGHMQRYLAARPRDKHGRHDYRAEDFGLDPVRDRERFSRYYETYLAD